MRDSVLAGLIVVVFSSMKKNKRKFQIIKSSPRHNPWSEPCVHRLIAAAIVSTGGTGEAGMAIYHCRSYSSRQLRETGRRRACAAWFQLLQAGHDRGHGSPNRIGQAVVVQVELI